MKDNILVSVVIPTKNGASTIFKCLNAISEQTLKKLEVILIDSGSTDNTLAIAAQFNFVRIIEILPHTFNHGLTRNLGASEAKGKFVLLTVQDAYASSNDWIEKMLNHFLHDKEVVGVCGQQIVPHDPDKNPHEWFRSFSEPIPKVVEVKDRQKLAAMLPVELHSLCGWDNVNAMYRKSILLEYPFEEVSFGEDMRWIKRVVLDGKKVVYDYSCRVYHYHHGTYNYIYKRTLTVLYHTYKNFGYLRKLRYPTAEYLKVIYRNFKYRVSPLWITFNWRRMNAATKAYRDAARYLRMGEDALDKFHDEECGRPPQGQQNIKR
ncbi:glycosyltransferase family 2 protein [Pontibacter chitinilyticus]|uniref:glycosyltransferase family 2 protein n=1 Tax=Pontibacter chitinilyticus TaxID=2674989 RepID=UPI00321B1B41